MTSIAPVAAQTTQKKPIASRKIALVIGIKSYEPGSGVERLETPVSDAAAVADKLKAIGFDITRVTDPTSADLRRALLDFAAKIPTAEIVSVYYAGHGFQATTDGAGSVKLFVPTDFRGPTSANAPEASAALARAVASGEIMGLDMIQSVVRKHDKVGLFFWDACRNNPFYKAPVALTIADTETPNALPRRDVLVRSLGERGLVRAETSQPEKRPKTRGPRGVILQSATQPGNVAIDSNGRHSPYTEVLLKHLATPGVSIEAMLRGIATDVDQATGGTQKPQTEIDLMGGELVLVPAAPAPSIAPAARPASVQPASAPAAAAPVARPAPERATPRPAQASAGQNSGAPSVPKMCDGRPCRTQAKFPDGRQVIISTTPTTSD